MAFLFTSLVAISIASLPGWVFPNVIQMPNTISPFMIWATAVWVVAILGAIWLWSATVQRLHDMGVSGWWCILVYLFPILLFVLYLYPGTPGYNRYGERIHPIWK